MPPRDAPSAPPLGSRDVGRSSPTAPSPRSAAADALMSRPLSGRSEEDESLYRDLLRKAKGNTALADRWLAALSGTAGGGGAVPASAPPLPPGEGGAPLATASATIPPHSDLDAAAADAGAPPTFFCPIGLSLFRDPVMLPTGQSYERAAIQRWLAAGNATCPATGQRLGRPVPLTPNVALRRSVEDWCEAHAPWALGADGHVVPLPAVAEERDGGGDGAAGLAASTAGAACGAPPPPPPAPADPALAEALRRQEAEWAALQAASRGVPPPPQPALHPRPPPLPAWHGAAPAFYPQPRPPTLAARASSTASSLALYAMEGGLLAAFIISLWRNGWGIAPLSVNPCVGAAPATLYGMGAKDTPALLAGQWWRLAASAGLSAGAIDLLATAALTVSLGRLVGRSVVAPWLTVPALFVGGSALGGLASANLLPRSDAVGAPAGAAALWGAAVAFQALHWRAYAHRALSAVVLVLVGAALAAVGLTPLHDNWYTLGAAGAGVLAAGALGRPGGPGGGGWDRRPVSVADAAAAGEGGRAPPRGRRPAGRIFGSLLFRLLCAAGLAAGASAGVLGLTRGAGAAGDACGWCPRLGCLETRWWACAGGGGGGGGGGGASGGGGGGAEGTTPAGTPSCSFSADGDQTRVTCPSGAFGFIKGPPPAEGGAQVSACDKVCQPWRPVDPPKDKKQGPAPPPPAPAQGGKYDPAQGVLV